MNVVEPLLDRDCTVTTMGLFLPTPAGKVQDRLVCVRAGEASTGHPLPLTVTVPSTPKLIPKPRK